jgi:DNA repair exonuclease SbcCD ATPase subunit
MSKEQLEQHASDIDFLKSWAKIIERKEIPDLKEDMQNMRDMILPNLTLSEKRLNKLEDRFRQIVLKQIDRQKEIDKQLKHFERTLDRYTNRDPVGPAILQKLKKQLQEKTEIIERLEVRAIEQDNAIRDRDEKIERLTKQMNTIANAINAGR